MLSVIGSIGGVVFPITGIQVFERTWCLWELLCAAKADADIQLSVPLTGYRADHRHITNEAIDGFHSVRTAGTTYAEDRAAILDGIEKYFGSFDDADAYIRQLLNSKRYS